MSETFYVYPEEGYIEKECGVFARGRRNFRITYTAGYVTIPASLKYLCNEIVSQLYHNRNKWGVVAEKMGDYSVTYQHTQNAFDALPGETKARLAPFKRWHLV